MAILRRATEQQQTNWRPVPDKLWRWQIEKPDLSYSDQFQSYRVKFPLVLTESERERLKEEYGDPPEGQQQSWRANYTVGLSLGYIQRTGEYKSTKLVDFLSAALGSANQRAFRQWIAQGGGPTPTSEDDEAEAIISWLGWWEGLEIYGSISHEQDKNDPNTVWARFGGPMPVGSLPGEKEPDYQALGKGKMRAMIAETDGSVSEDMLPHVRPDSSTDGSDSAASNEEPKQEPPVEQYDELFGTPEEAKAG